MAKETLIDAIEQLAVNNGGIMVESRVVDFEDGAYADFVSPLLDLQEDMVERLTWISNTLISIEKGIIKLVNLNVKKMAEDKMKEGVNKTRKAEEPEAKYSKKEKVIKKEKEKSGLDFVDLMSGLGLAALAYKLEIVESIKGLLHKISQAVIGWFVVVKNLVVSLLESKYIVALRANFSKLTSSLTPFFKRFGTFISKMAAGIKNLLGLIPFSGAIGGWIAKLGLVVKFLALPLTIGIGIYEAVMGAKEDMEGLSDNATMFDTVVTGISGALKGIVNFLIGGLLDLGKSLVSWIIEYFAGEGNRVSSFLDSFSFQDVLGSVIDAARDMIMSIAHWISDIVNQIRGGAAKRMVNNIVKYIKNALDSILQQMFSWIVTTIIKLNDLLPGTMFDKEFTPEEKKFIRSVGVDPKTGEKTELKKREYEDVVNSSMPSSTVPTVEKSSGGTGVEPPPGGWPTRNGTETNPVYKNGREPNGGYISYEEMTPVERRQQDIQFFEESLEPLGDERARSMTKAEILENHENMIFYGNRMIQAGDAGYENLKMIDDQIRRVEIASDIVPPEAKIEPLKGGTNVVKIEKPESPPLKTLKSSIDSGILEKEQSAAAEKQASMLISTQNVNNTTNNTTKSGGMSTDYLSTSDDMDTGTVHKSTYSGR